ncbi:glutamate--cysteine ligase [Alkaliphilus serpentinus]|uniref:Glutamate--cysteine ligase n=1 Tax=Alkaliphilus serpentinus TaxID=1482731 RepID=A0A833HQY4_9FIRM|nr:glutamate-cysteine ligase family protein [Alkaliphilus serpentinus]KAB3532508.1 glutamate--cysteine ligase [Alkaliphilus serpentinus]
MEYQEKLDSITSILREGEKSTDQFSLGAEFEHIIVDKASFESINYYQEKGTETILNKMLANGYTPKYEGGYLIGLEKADGIITLEPGGQLELSIKPCKTIKEIEDIYFSFLENIIPILEEQNQLLLAIGYHPKSVVDEIPFNPKKRYSYMSQYFKERGGTLAHNMMKGTASLQVVIDYEDEKDFIKKFKVAHFISPLLALITDNAPIFEGKFYDLNSVRSTIWENTDFTRGGLVKGVMDKEFGYVDYAKYILSLPPIFIIKDKEVIDTQGKTTEELLELYPLNKDEVDHILSMAFPDVRARKYIEIRMGDSIPYPLSFSYIALVKGLFYNQEVLEYLYKLSESTDDQKLFAYRRSMVEKGLMGCFRCKNIYEILQMLIDLAKRSLSHDEKGFLKPLEELVLKRKTPAIVSKELLKGQLEDLTALQWCSLNYWFGRQRDGIEEIV